VEVQQMLADQLDYVIGVDSHRDRHAFAVVSAAGVVESEQELDADPAGYRQALALAGRHASGRRVWAIEGTGSYGAGLARFLSVEGEAVLEVERPRKTGSRGRLKSDRLDALRAAKAVLAGEQLARPRGSGDRESLRALLVTREGAVAAKRASLGQLRSLLVSCPEPLRSKLRPLPTTRLLRRCAAMRPRPGCQHGQLLALRACARRTLTLQREANELEQAISAEISRLAPSLLDQPGIGAITAAQLLISWSEPDRVSRGPRLQDAVLGRGDPPLSCRDRGSTPRSWSSVASGWRSRAAARSRMSPMIWASSRRRCASGCARRRPTRA
jgi:transposase